VSGDDAEQIATSGEQQLNIQQVLSFPWKGNDAYDEPAGGIFFDRCAIRKQRPHLHYTFSVLRATIALLDIASG